MAEPIDMAALHPAVPAADRLNTLAVLREVGAISEAEYEAQRAAIDDETLYADREPPTAD